MGNILNYIEEYGDKSFEQKALNEVDGLVFSVFSYADFSGIVPMSSVGGISLRKAVALYFKKKRTRVETLNDTFVTDIRSVLTKCAHCDRYRNMKLLSFYSRTNKKRGEQFGALAIEYVKNNAFIAFRGTDNTVIGWQEDFAMSYKHVASQLDAVDFLSHFLGMWKGNAIIGGHSKGGNLAMYSALMCPEAANRVSEVYNYDGPGLSKELITMEGFKAVRDKLHSYIPQASIVGMIFEREYEKQIIKSSGIGLKQHNPMSWNVRNTSFITEKNVNTTSLLLEDTMKQWLSEIDDNTRKEFTNTIFGVMQKNGYSTFNQVANKKGTFVFSCIKSFNSMNYNRKKMFNTTVFSFMKAGVSGFRRKVIKVKQ